MNLMNPMNPMKGMKEMNGRSRSGGEIANLELAGAARSCISKIPSSIAKRPFVKGLLGLSASALDAVAAVLKSPQRLGN